MALKLKLDEAGHVVLKDGKPVYVDDADNQEFAFDAEELRGRISALNTESKTHRLKAKELEERLSSFGDADPAQVASFRKTLEEYGGIEGLAELKKKGTVDVEAVKKSLIDSYEVKLKEASGKIEQLAASERQLLVGNGIATSKFLSGTTFKDTRDVAEAYFGNKFKVENGKAVAYDGDEPVFSRANPGQLATVDEALEYFVNKHPQRDAFIIAPGGGSGAGNPGKGNFGIKSRADFKTDADKSKFISENGLQAFKDLPAE